LEAVRQRVVAAILEIAVRHPADTVAVVAHKGTNRLFLCHILGMEPRYYRRVGQENAALNLLTYEGARWRVHLVNDTLHLRAT
jgi:broad specificity phosphatase PhoE